MAGFKGVEEATDLVDWDAGCDKKCYDGAHGCSVVVLHMF